MFTYNIKTIDTKFHEYKNDYIEEYIMTIF